MSACGKLHAATLELAKSTSIKQRLTLAFSKHLKHIDASELPLSLQEQLATILQSLESVRPLPGESSVQATVRKMSAEDADRYAAQIVDLFGAAAASRALPAVARAPEPSSVTAFRERGEARHSGNLLYAAEA
jgi:hypothetical protein